ncbi:putative NAD(P)/FAD-binding protein YdhS [Tahibacter aquaticus]|uniref:Putative NAD(P)/FAD-binding protein YdhS n=1 Tax=Tahibacter aquaticus TaxID=520092 RepID=A0A4R6YMQ0_9GAMM|nr:FAD/NAD(P)-binding protein [Tahibacter aquaticus]TDR38755.1 putative NAD(P)/FAD-binding protein YdhS [Tahibacter aquaticus]
MGTKVAIVGGGAAAAFVITELLEHGVGMPAELHWYSGRRGGSRGVAYATPVDEHLLNVRATAMGLNSAEPTEFLDFARQHLPNARGGDFLPRRLYGDYLEARVSRAFEGASFRGIRASRLRTEIDSIAPAAGGGYVLTDSTGYPNHADIVVVATGALPARALPQACDALIEAGRYVLDPWQWLSANTLPFDKLRKVLIVGSGLSAVDLALSVTERWPQVRVTLLSRRGRLPAAHVRDAQLPAEGLNELLEDLREHPDLRSWTRLVRSACDEADDWRSVVDSLRHATPQLWQSLGEVDRRRFLRHLRGIWEIGRHRMPPQVARRMLELQADRRIETQAGRIQSFRAGKQNRPILAWTQAPRHDSVQVASYDLVLQCVGMDTEARSTTHGLVRSLLQRGLATPDRLGLGLHADKDGRLAPDQRLWTLGALCRGRDWESTAIPEIRQQARRIAVQLFRELASDTAREKPPRRTAEVADIHW